MNDRVGFAIVGLGKLALGQILPAFAHTQHCRVAALVSGHSDKALKLARKHKLQDSMVFDYANFDRLADQADVEINGVRNLSGEEPYEIAAIQQSPLGDSRFREVEETVHFTLGFPSGLRALCHTSYGTHRCNFLRLVGTEGWAELDPAYSYGGLKLRVAAAAHGETAVDEPPLPAADPFALEMDHMASCVREGRRPYSPGEEGLQDQRLMEAIYVSAREGGRPMKLDVIDGGTWRGPEPAEAAPRVM